MSKNIANIENVAAHLYNRVSYEDIVVWLNNFEEEEQANALRLLGYMNFFTSDRIYASLKNSLEQIVTDIPHGKIKIVAVRAMKKDAEGIHGGHSGHMISYYARKVAEVVNKKRISVINEKCLEELRSSHRDAQYTIVFIDDIFGSGDTLLDFYNYISRPRRLPKAWRVVALSVVYMPQAVGKLKRVRIKLYGEPVISIFKAIRDAGMADSYNEPIYKNLAIKYGRKLYQAKAGEIKTLGYKNAQALVAFEYGVPNNTIPIIWASANESGTGYDWHPVFPRNIKDRIGKYHRDMIDRRRWFFMAYKAGLHITDANNVNIGWGNALRIYMILSMIEKQKDEILIMNFLAIGKEEYEECIANARKNRLLDNTCHITEKAKMILAEIDEYTNKEKEIVVSEINDKIYLPDDQ